MLNKKTLAILLLPFLVMLVFWLEKYIFLFYLCSIFALVIYQLAFVSFFKRNTSIANQEKKIETSFSSLKEQSRQTKSFLEKDKIKTVCFLERTKWKLQVIWLSWTSEINILSSFWIYRDLDYEINFVHKVRRVSLFNSFDTKFWTVYFVWSEKQLVNLINNWKETKIELSISQYEKDFFKEWKRFQTKSWFLVRSNSERLIADLLFDLCIRFLYEAVVENNNWKAVPDFYLLDYGIYLEYWWFETEEYKKNSRRKKALYKKSNIKVIEVYPRALWWESLKWKPQVNFVKQIIINWIRESLN